MRRTLFRRLSAISACFVASWAHGCATGSVGAGPRDTQGRACGGLDPLADDGSLYLLSLERMGIEIREADVDRAVARVRVQSGLDEAAFWQAVADQGLGERTYRHDVGGELARLRVLAELWRRPTRRELDAELESRYGDAADWSEDEREEVRRELLAEATADGASRVERNLRQYWRETRRVDARGRCLELAPVVDLDALSFEGAVAIGELTLRATLGEAGRTFELEPGYRLPSSARQLLESAYYEEGHLELRHELVREAPLSWRLRIDEGPVYRIGRLVVIDAVSRGPVHSGPLPVAPGDVYVRSVIVELARRIGADDVETALRSEDARVDITLVVAP